MDPRNRFTGRVDHYIRFRPGYPDAVIEALREKAGWTAEAAVADIGAGTGISSELFLRHGNRVWAVEPNAEMRAAAETLRTAWPKLEVVDGSAEATNLSGGCADFVAAATAFHWFDARTCRAEFGRILKPGGFVILMWNKRQAETSPFLRAYEDLLVQYGTDYKDRWGSERRGLTQRVADFFRGEVQNAAFENPQYLDLEGLTGRLLSSSYAPLPGHPNYQPMLDALAGLFTRFEKEGRVAIEYLTTIYWGRLADA